MPEREQHPTPVERDEPVKIDLDPETALRGLLEVDPDAPPAKRNEDEPVAAAEPLKDQGDPLGGNS